MKYLFVNVVCGIKSTGRICTDLAQSLEREGNIVKIAYGREEVPPQFERFAVKIGDPLSFRINAAVARVLDNDGFFAIQETKKFLRWADSYNPDVIWLHNLHGYYINVSLLFEWIKSRPNMIVKWTLHDCWAFTGHCAYFSYIGCEKWKNECFSCEQKNSYPKSIFLDKSNSNYHKKKELFSGITNLTIIVPSYWLANLVSKSFLSDYKLEVHYNTIDKTIFKPTSSDIRKRYKLNGKTVILGVASTWDERKGLNYFIQLSELLDERFVIVLVGLNSIQISKLPDSIIGLEKTNNAIELAQIYTAADIFLNPSVEETFGMTTLEALACGTKAIVFKGTACEEVATRNGGYVVEQNLKSITDMIYKLK